MASASKCTGWLSHQSTENEILRKKLILEEFLYYYGVNEHPQRTTWE
jgi:hypothetical protein